MWEHAPDPAFVARPRRDAKGAPANGSDHNRGCAVDVGISARGWGLGGLGGLRPLPMGSDFDDFTPAAHHSAAGIGVRERRNRALLRGIMERAGFAALEQEWWHYHDPQCCARHPEVLDIPLERALEACSPQE